MKNFIKEDFMINNKTGLELYNIVKNIPIIDYHCHIDPKEICEDKNFIDITDVWLKGDHYKWRLMRNMGIEEGYITGEKNSVEKFEKYARTIEKSIGNPVYTWSHLELLRGCDINEVLTSRNFLDVYEKASGSLKNLSPSKIFEKFNVEVLCTTDDPIDDLKYHKEIKNNNKIKTKVLPTFRPDKIINIEKDEFNDYLNKFKNVVDFPIHNVEDLLKAIEIRIKYFKEVGSIVSDHGLDYLMYEDYTIDEVDVIFKKAINGEHLTKKEIDKYKTLLTVFCGEKYKENDITMQIHFGCLRNNNILEYNRMGPDCGHDAINKKSGVENLGKLLSKMYMTNNMPRIILYSLDPSDNDALVTIKNCFNGGANKGEVRQGSAWWFNDSDIGMKNQMDCLARNGVLGTFIGMVTDSRSFLSYTRHELFRRVLCDYIGEIVDKGKFPRDMDLLKEIVEDISYNNAKSFLKL